MNTQPNPKRSRHQGALLVPVGPLFAPIEGDVWVPSLAQAFPTAKRAKATLDARREAQVLAAAGQATLAEPEPQPHDSPAHQVPKCQGR